LVKLVKHSPLGADPTPVEFLALLRFLLRISPFGFTFAPGFHFIPECFE